MFAAIRSFVFFVSSFVDFAAAVCAVLHAFLYVGVEDGRVCCGEGVEELFSFVGECVLFFVSCSFVYGHVFFVFEFFEEWVDL